MPPLSRADMIEAARLTRSGQLAEATALIQASLAGAAPSHSAPETPFAPGPSSKIAEQLAARLGSFSASANANSSSKPTLQDGARFEEHVFANGKGERTYKLYVPARSLGDRPALIVMLHGCTQSPDDFAAGTRMNELAEEFGFLVAYPGQPQSANASKCWNWFNASDQRRDSGEPALIAGLTRDIARDYKVDPDRIFIAGLSAGGAAAAIMGATYPELYSAVGVHSGLACGAAHDLASAFQAMQRGSASPQRIRRTSGRPTRVIVFHGDMDRTVSPVNADQVIAQFGGAGSALRTDVTQGLSDGGLSYTRTVRSTPSGEPILEQWAIHGAAHAWAGGSSLGSYTDPRGPDASRAMVRFFLGV